MNGKVLASIALLTLSMCTSAATVQPPAKISSDPLVTCLDIEFQASALSAARGAERADDPAAAALQALISNGQGVVGMPSEGYRVLARSPNEALFGLGEPPELLVAQVKKNAQGIWETGSNGYCSPRPVKPGLRAGEWVVDPEKPLQGNGRSFTVLVSGSECSSGVGVKDRMERPIIEYADDSVTVTYFVRPPPPGFHTCPSDTPAASKVELREPLGKRRLLDGGFFPAQDRVLDGKPKRQKPGPTIKVAGPFVRGASFVVFAAGLKEYAGKEVGLELVDPTDVVVDDIGALGFGGHPPIPENGTLELQAFVPELLGNEGPPVTVGKQYKVRLLVGLEPVPSAEATITISGARPGVSYPTRLTNECGPPRVHFDGLIWLPDPPLKSQELPALGSPGKITIGENNSARFAFDDGRTTQLLGINPAEARFEFRC